MTRRDGTDGTTVAIAGGKGGCGKTTTTLGLALALVDRGHEPIVVDADVDIPDLHIRAGVAREPGIPAVAAGDRPVRALQPSTRYPGVSVLATGTATTEVETALERVARTPRPVVIDCPAGAGPDVSAPLRAAHRSVVVTTTDPASRVDAAKTARMADTLGATPAATVRRARPEQADGTVDWRREEAHLDGRPVPTREVVVPHVEGRPLARESVRDGYETVAAALGW